MIRANIPFVQGNFYHLKQKNEKVTTQWVNVK